MNTPIRGASVIRRALVAMAGFAMRSFSEWKTPFKSGKKYDAARLLDMAFSRLLNYV